MTKDADAENGNVVINVEQQSQSLSGPSESLANGSNAWIGRLRSSGSTDGSPDSGAQLSRKGKEKVDPPCVFHYKTIPPYMRSVHATSYGCVYSRAYLHSPCTRVRYTRDVTGACIVAQSYSSSRRV